MLKKSLFIFMLCIPMLYADLLEDKVKNIMGEDDYLINKNLVSVLFKKRSNFYTSENMLNIDQVVSTLKANGLLKLTLNNPEYLEVQFITKSEPIKTIKLVNDFFKDLGYYHFYTSRINHAKDSQTIFNIRLKTQAIIDPTLLMEKFAEHNCTVFDISVNENNIWSYHINTKRASLPEIIEIVKTEQTELNKPMKPYFIQVSDASNLIVHAKPNDHWHAHIVFYDKNLNVLEILKSEKLTKSIKVDVPTSTQYIKISDLFHLHNIKRGLSVLIN